MTGASDSRTPMQYLHSMQKKLSPDLVEELPALDRVSPPRRWILDQHPVECSLLPISLRVSAWMPGFLAPPLKGVLCIFSKTF